MSGQSVADVSLAVLDCSDVLLQKKDPSPGPSGLHKTSCAIFSPLKSTVEDLTQVCVCVCVCYMHITP